MGGKQDKDDWLTSVEARGLLRVSTCQLAHLRNAGKLRFRKEGNAFLYSANGCRILAAHSGSDANTNCSLGETHDRGAIT